MDVKLRRVPYLLRICRATQYAQNTHFLRRVSARIHRYLPAVWSAVYRFQFMFFSAIWPALDGRRSGEMRSRRRSPPRYRPGDPDRPLNHICLLSYIGARFVSVA